MKHILFLLLFFSLSAHCQIHFHHLNVSNGLSQNSIFSLCQDSIGFIWIGTAESGLNKFDGKNITYYNYSKAEDNSLPSNCITKLVAGEKGDIWIGTNNGLAYYDASNEKITQKYYRDKNNILYSFSKQHITSIKKTDNGSVWVVASGKLYFKEPENIIFTPYSNTDSRSISDIEPFGKNMLLVAYENNIEVLNIEKNLSDPMEIVHPQFNNLSCLYQDRYGIIYIGSKGNGFAVYNPKTDSTKYYTKENYPNIKSNLIRTFKQDIDGNVYIASFNGLYRLSSQSNNIEAFYSEGNHNNRLSHNSIYDILIDKSGNAYFATYSGGVSIKNATQYDFVTYSLNIDKKGTLRSNVINTFYEDNHGFWIGTDGAGMAHLKDGLISHYRHSEKNNSSISGNHVKTFLKHSPNKLWIGGHKAGLDLFNQKTLECERSFFSDKNIYCIERDPNNILWLASPHNGILFLDENNLLPIELNIAPYEKMQFAKFVRYSEKHQIMWICTTNGFFFYNFKTKKTIEIKDYSVVSLSIDNIHHLYEDSKSNTWIATSNGLLKLSGINTLTGDCDIVYFNNQNILPSNNIMAVLEDSNNQIWISTINSIIKIDSTYNKIKEYNHDYNIQTSDFTKAAAFKSKDGRLWFGGNGGFTVFNPNNIKSNTFVPKLSFTRLKINDRHIKPAMSDNILSQNISLTSELNLRHWQNNISISLASFNYTMPDRNQYKWTLKDTDGTYITGKSSEILAHNLPSGNYLLQAMASNNDNIWNPKPLELQIRIHPPWYRTVYAIFSYIILSIISVIVGRKVIIERTKVLNQLKIEKLQKIEKEKLHHQKVQFFTNISHEIRTPLSLISGPLEHIHKTNTSEETGKHLEIVSRNIRHLKKLIDELIDFRKLEGGMEKLQVNNLDINRFTRNITDFFSQSLSYQDTTIKFSSEYSEKAFFDPIVLEKIIFNLLYNAYKYNKDQKEITLFLSSEYMISSKGYYSHKIGNAFSKNNQYVVISVLDNGQGIPKNKISKIFRNYYQSDKSDGYGIGLSYVQKLIELHRGEITVLSLINKGSCFAIKIPVGEIDYQTDEIRKSPFEWQAEEQQQNEHALPFTEKKNTKQNTILIVEDNLELIEWMNMVLSKQYKCLLASNGQEGIRIAEEKLPDIIISDVMMPLMNGYELCESLKSNVKTSHIPIILLTAKSTIADKKEGIGFGADAHISKPFDTDILIFQVNNFLRLKEKIITNYNSNTEDSSRTFVDSLSVIDRKLIESVNEYISNNLNNPNITVDDMANSLYTSRSSLYRKIKSLTNTTPNEFIKDYRLKIAHSLIKEKELSISEVAEKVGFHDIYYFKKCFIKKYGIKPNDL